MSHMASPPERPQPQGHQIRRDPDEEAFDRRCPGCVVRRPCHGRQLPECLCDPSWPL